MVIISSSFTSFLLPDPSVALACFISSCWWLPSGMFFLGLNVLEDLLLNKKLILNSWIDFICKKKINHVRSGHRFQAERRASDHSLLTFLLAAVEPLTNVLCSFPFWFSLNSVTMPKLSSLIWSIVSLGYWQPRNSMFPNVWARPTCNTVWTSELLIIIWTGQHWPTQIQGICLCDAPWTSSSTASGVLAHGGICTDLTAPQMTWCVFNL